MVYPHNGLILTNKKKLTIDMHKYLDESAENYAENKNIIFKKLNTVCFILHSILEIAKL